MHILDLIFPKTCLGCGRDGKYLCANCVGKVRVLGAVCPYCEKASIDGFTHVKCRKKYGLDGLTSIWDYDGVVKKAILALKFKYSTEVGRELSLALVRALKSQNTKYYIPNTGSLVPVPIHWRRKNVRGFNQSEETGKHITGDMGWEFSPELLIKQKPTVSQVELSVEERKRNLKGVFVLNPKLKPPASAILFDDVFTTGSTLNEAAKVLKHGGVGRVWGLTIAR